MYYSIEFYKFLQEPVWVDVKTEIAQEIFQWLSRFARNCQSMSVTNLYIFLYTMFSYRNEQTVRYLADNDFGPVVL